jgi:hypothetical protein
MDLYSIVVGAILLFPWSLVLLPVTGAILQRRRRWTAGREPVMGGRAAHDGAKRSAGF